jgi:hypothetical protein
MTTVCHDYIEMRQRRFNYFPQSFRWHGLTYYVQAVERSWTKMGGRLLRRRAERLCFRVRAVALLREGALACPPSKFDIYQDLIANTWHLERQLA